MNIEFVPATPALIKRNISVLLMIDAAVPGEPWQEENFLLELPDKWTLSRVAVVEGGIRGFCIASRKGDCMHLHRLAVSAAFQGIRLGTALLDHMVSIARENSMRAVCLKVNEKNERAIGLYRRYGFNQVEKDIGTIAMKFLLSGYRHA